MIAETKQRIMENLRACEIVIGMAISQVEREQVEAKEETCLEWEDLPTDLKQLDKLLDNHVLKIAGWQLSKEPQLNADSPYCTTNKSGQRDLHDDLGNAMLYLLSCAGCFARK